LIFQRDHEGQQFAPCIGWERLQFGFEQVKTHGLKLCPNTTSGKRGLSKSQFAKLKTATRCRIAVREWVQAV
jgi:hypothetical protein